MIIAKIFHIFLLSLSLAVFSLIPFSVFAEVEFNFFNFDKQDDYQILSELESKKILLKFPSEVFQKWIDLKFSGYYDPMETTTLSLLKEVIQYDLFNYIFSELPADVSVNIAKHSIEIAKLIGAEDTSGLIGKFEKETVNLAVKYAKEYLLKNELKVSFGAMKVQYGKGESRVDSLFQYIMIYKPIDDKKGRVVARIYSPNEIDPPASRGSVGMAKGFLNDLPEGQNISPFVVEISGIIEKTELRDYKWSEDPSITVNFPANVPDFGLRPRTWQDKYIIEPIKNKLKEFSDLFNAFFPKGEITDYIFKEDNKDEEAINQEIQEMEQGKTVEQEVEEEKKILEEKKQEEIRQEQPEEKKEEPKEEPKEEIVQCSKLSALIPSKTIIINEIAWMGTKASSNDEWIELKNISDKEIDLKGWRLIDKGDQINIVFKSLIVPQGGFVLLERTDDSTIPFKAADVIYSGSLSNNDEELFLFNPKCNLEDAVFALPEWEAGDNDEKRTMERGFDMTWHSYSSNGEQDIFGTPKAENSEKIAVVPDQQSIVYASSSTKEENISYCSQSNSQSPAYSPIIISEIAWMGTNTSSSDEWIELKNISNDDVNLNGWQLIDKEEQIKIIFKPEDTIQANGYYLLERTDDYSVPNIIANKIYTGALSDTIESLRLFNQNCSLIDEASANPDWPAGNKINKKTMERVNNQTWQTYLSSVADTNTGLYGTPIKDNSIVENIQVGGSSPITSSGGEGHENIIITEVEINGLGGNEYVEIFNKGDTAINLCPNIDNNCYYLTYYASDNNWHDPSNSWRFPENVTINPNSYYLIDIYGDNGGDWNVANYLSSRLSNSSGSLSLFYNNPVYPGEDTKTEAELISYATNLKVDTIGWKSSELADDPVVRESDAFIITEDNKVMGRKWYQNYTDNNDNLTDFRLESSSIRTHVLQAPDIISNLSIIQNPDQINSVILSWSVPNDPDSDESTLSYDIYFSKGEAIDESSLVNILSYVSPSEVDVGTSNKKYIIPDLYFDSIYYFIVKASDPENNSSLSNEESFIVPAGSHKRQAPYANFSRSNHSPYTGIINEKMGTSLSIIESADGRNDNDFLNRIVVVDANYTSYFIGELDGEWGVFAYNSLGIRKWMYVADSQISEVVTLGNDGTIYFSRQNSLFALSPSGKLKWTQNFSYLYSTSTALDIAGYLYLIASVDPDAPMLFAIDDSGTTYDRTVVFDIDAYLGANPIVNFSEIVIDSEDYFYFSHQNTVFKCKLNEGKIAEKVITPKYNENYDLRDVPVIISEVYVSSSGVVLLSAYRSGCCTLALNSFDVFYSLSNDLGTINWEKDNYSNPIGINGDEFYIYTIADSAYTLSGISIDDGSINWSKSWTGNHPSTVVSTDNNRVYFIVSGYVLGYDKNIITDTDLTHDTIFSFIGATHGSGCPVSLTDRYLYVPNLNKITRIEILP